MLASVTIAAGLFTAAGASSQASQLTSSSTPTLPGQVVAISATGTGGLVVASNDGGVTADGSAKTYGSTYSDGMTGLGGSHPLAAPIVGMASLPSGNGYYLVGADGGVFNFGSAPYHGSTYTYGITGLSGKRPLNAPIVGMASTPHGNGYWLVAADGGVFNFGSAKFYGSTYTYGITGLSGKRPLNAPIVAIVPTPDGRGYWLIAKDGGVFDFGDAHFYGSTYTYGITGLSGKRPLAAPIVGAAASPGGGGYYLVAADGGVFDFGDAHFDGSSYSLGYTGLGGSNPLPSPVASIAPDPNGNGYWAITKTGKVLAFGSAAALPPVSTSPTAPSPASTTPNQRALQIPASNVKGTYNQACFDANMSAKQTNTPACLQAALVSLNAGRASEGLPNVQLPSNFDSLPRIDQLFILINEERVVRGLPPVYGIASALQSDALTGAQNNADPVLTANIPSDPYGNYASIYAFNYSTIADVFEWMYDDGYGGTNYDCTTPTSPGCWGHRENILATTNSGYSEIMGVASVNTNFAASTGTYMEKDAAIFVPIATSDLSQMTYIYTWAQAVADGA
ncbi:MAG: CAP domain-containing protein [Ferrimicrobium acidiphilum]